MKPEELEIKAAAELAKQQAFDVRLFTCSSRGCQSSEALGVIAGLLALSIGASLWATRRAARKARR